MAWVLMAMSVWEPVNAHQGHGAEYSLGYVLLMVGLLLLLAKLYKRN
ncbi:MAG: hypothetical protein QNJ56_04560 [Gammaproteobacteria bacterium]|nr:hypothetical protein [Gammaproteobacteria bacterium]